MKVKVNEASGPVLDWMVAKCQVKNDIRDNRPRFWLHPNNPKLVCKIEYNYTKYPEGYSLCSYSTDRSEGEPIIEQERIAIWPDEEGGWLASANDGKGDDSHGPTELIAAMRCYVALKLGYEVEVPGQLA